MASIHLSDAQQTRLCQYLDTLIRDPEFLELRDREQAVLQELEGRLDPTAMKAVKRLRSTASEALTWHIFRVAQWAAENL